MADFCFEIINALNASFNPITGFACATAIVSRCSDSLVSLIGIA
jgi:hypothetical protein